MSNESASDTIKKRIDELFDGLGRSPKQTVARRDVSVRMSDGKIIVTDCDMNGETIQTTTMSYAAAKDHIVHLQNAIATIDAAVAAGIAKIEDVSNKGAG